MNGVKGGGHVGIVTFEKLNYKAWSKTMPRFHHKPLMTRSYNLAYTKAIAAGATLSEAEAAAWEAFRSNMSRKANKAFHAVFTATKSKNKAMSAFWKECPRSIPRPKAVLKTYQNGRFVLDTGREIDQRMLAAKFNAGEIELRPDQVENLRKLLTSKGMTIALYAFERFVNTM